MKEMLYPESVPIHLKAVFYIIPSCSKLKTLLVNISLIFQTYISQMHQFFCWKNERRFCSAKASLIFSTKNISVVGYKVIKHLTS